MVILKVWKPVEEVVATEFVGWWVVWLCNSRRHVAGPVPRHVDSGSPQLLHATRSHRTFICQHYHQLYFQHYYCYLCYRLWYSRI